MALLRIPDKYIQERGGWKSDKIMKRVYTQTFAEEWERVDDTIDEYFENILDSKEQKKKERSEQTQKIRAWHLPSSCAAEDGSRTRSTNSGKPLIFRCF